MVFLFENGHCCPKANGFSLNKAGSFLNCAWLISLSKYISDRIYGATAAPPIVYFHIPQ
jgi:hypothetical protein